MDTKAACRVLGVDTSLRSTGIGVVEAEGSALRVLDFGRIVNAPKLPLSRCLESLQSGVVDLIAKYSPHSVAIEGVFFCKNVRTAVTLGEARGVVIAAAARAGLSVFEYAPRRVKQAVTSNGAAGKEQVRRMVMTLLHMTSEPQEDASDALAIALCHLNNFSRIAAIRPEPI